MSVGLYLLLTAVEVFASGALSFRFIIRPRLKISAPAPEDTTHSIKI